MAKYLDNNGLLYFWQKIKNTFALKSELPGIFAGATSTTAGSSGLVPGPAAGTNKYLNIDGTWKQISGDDILRGEGYTASVAFTFTEIERVLGNYSESINNKSDIGHKHSAADITSGTLPVSRGGTGVSTLGAGVLYHAANGTGAISVATAANLVSALGNNAVNRATSDASGNNIANTYAKKTDISGMYKYKGSVASESALPTTGRTSGDVYNIESASSYGAPGANVAWNGTTWDSLGEIFQIEAITNGEIDTIVTS